MKMKKRMIGVKMNDRFRNWRNVQGYRIFRMPELRMQRMEVVPYE